MFNRFFGILLMGFVIKIMDDYFDQEIDKQSNQWNINFFIGSRSILPYLLLLTIISLYLNFNEAVSIFVSSYIIGMLHSYREIPPTKLQWWQEGIIIIFVFAYILSFKELLAGILIIGIIQLIDDIIDYKRERFINFNNVINKFGFFNTISITLLLLFFSIRLFPIKCAYFFTASFLLYIIFFIIQKFCRVDYNE